MADPATEPRPLTGGAVMSAASRVSVAATGALTTVLIARLLGPDGSGGYFLAQSVVLLLTVTTTLGVEHGITYYVSSGVWAPRSAFVAAMRMAAVAGTAGAGLGVLARLLVPSAFAELTVAETAVACAALPFALAWFYASFIALAIDRYEAYVLPPALQSLLAMVLAGGGAILFDLKGAIAGLALATVLVGVGMTAWSKRRLPRHDEAEPPGQLRRAVAFGIKGYAANALQLLNYRLDLFILSAAASSSEVGFYAVAVAVTGVLWLLPQAVADVLFPRIAHLSALKGETAEPHREMVELKGVRHVVIVAAAATVTLAGALLVLVVPVYGAQFRPAIDIGLVLLPGVALIGVSGVLSATIVGRGKPIYSLYTVLITTPPTILLYVLLIPGRGALGAALASSLSYAAHFALTAFFYRRLTKRRLRSVLVPTTSELQDLLALPGAARTWARGLRT